jgi:hypothetical protein
MGLLRFLTPQRDRLDEHAVDVAYVAGWDGIPTACHKTWEDQRHLRLERTADESGNLHIPWTVDGRGQWLLSTSSLMERYQPYHLPVELARGTLNRLRTRTEAWRTAGLQVSDELMLQIKSAQASFIHAATSQRDALAAMVSADETIRESLEGIDRLGREHAEQVLKVRHEEAGVLTTLLAGTMGDTVMSSNAGPMFCAAFNAAVVPCRWKTIQTAPDAWDWSALDKRIQWCRRNGLKILAGPLLRPDRMCLPDWLVASRPDFQGLTRALQTFVAAVVGRYRSDVHLWHCAAGTNAASVLPLSDDQKVRLTMIAIEMTRRVDARTPVFVSFDQPWGEYLTRAATDLWPIHFADMLVRADLGIAGIGLELNFGYWPGGTLLRDVLAVSEHVDFWSLLGLPLIVQLALPSSAEPDALTVEDAGRPLDAAMTGGLSPQNQQRLVQQLLPALLAKRSVHAVTWAQVFDSSPHKFANAGLFDSQDRPKPALSTLIATRREHLQ